MLKSILCAFLFLSLRISPATHAQDMAAAKSDSVNAEAVLRGETKRARAQWLRRQLFVENILTQNAVDLSDSTLLFRVRPQSPLRLDKSQLNAIAPRVDQIEDRLRREQLGLPPTFDMGNLIGKGVKYLAGKLGAAGAGKNPLAAIPSELEIDVMNVLWKKNAATTMEIYTDLDSVKLTAVDLQQTLAIMADRGLLDQRQISPRHEFTILGAISLETSAKNRKNREYSYRPKVTRQTMLTFLDAAAFSYHLASANNHVLILNHLHKLMNRMVVAEN